MSKYVYVCIAECKSVCNRHIYLLDTGELVIGAGVYIKESYVEEVREKVIGTGIFHGGQK